MKEKNGRSSSLQLISSNILDKFHSSCSTPKWLVRCGSLALLIVKYSLSISQFILNLKHSETVVSSFDYLDVALSFVASIAVLLPILYHTEVHSSARTTLNQSWGNIIFVISFTLANGFALFSACASPSSALTHRHQETLSPVPAAFLMMTPVILCVLFSDMSWRGHLVVYFLSLAFLLTAAVWIGTSSAGLLLSLHFLESTIVYLCVHERSLSNARLCQQIFDDEKATHVHDIEEQQLLMKTMMGNVAHDLKTPLSSFMVGVDVVLENLKTFRDRVGVQVDAQLQETLASTMNCLMGMHNTNAFMIMGINRALDYTKTSQGLKLTPKLETIPLLETLRLPLQCMRCLQNTVHIAFCSIPAHICPFIITDKQWLQENILCLLSNAVKYSVGGTVTIRVSLQPNLQVLALNVPTISTSFNEDTGRAISVRSVDLWGSNNKVRPSGSTSPASSHEGRRSIAARHRDWLLVEIEDEGIGLTEEARQSLFNPFKQSQRLAGGTGLGLFSLSQRVRALGGQCGVDKRHDGRQGSNFWFTIPYRADTQAALSHPEDFTATVDLSSVSEGYANSCAPPGPCPALPSTPTIVQVQSSPGRHQSLRSILLVEDSPSIAKMTAMMLRNNGFEVYQAINGAIALQLVEQQLSSNPSSTVAFDAILMDLQMPIMDGLEATRRLRSWERELMTTNGVALQPNTRHLVLGVSANCDEEIMEETERIGFDGFISKPFSLAAFQEILQSFSIPDDTLPAVETSS